LNPIVVVTAIIRDTDGWLLVVRKRGTTRYMLPGGKPESGEGPADTLARELREELGLALTAATAFGRFEAQAANEPGRRVVGHVHLAQVDGAPQVLAEIEDARWLSPEPPYPVPLAPLLEHQILPALRDAG
jgi:8-oxo-dGTP diphosphatase